MIFNSLSKRLDMISEDQRNLVQVQKSLKAAAYKVVKKTY